LTQVASLFDVRAGLLASFEAALLPLGLLDRYQVDGVIAGWWADWLYDLKTLAYQCTFAAVVESWVESIRATVGDEDETGRGNGDDPLAHPLIEHLMPGYLEKLEALEAQIATLKSQLAEATHEPEDEDEDEGRRGDPSWSPDEIKPLRNDLRAARSDLKRLQGEFLEQLEARRAGLTEDAARDLVLAIARERLETGLDRYVAARQQALVAALENLWDKYRVSLTEIEAGRDAARAKLAGLVEGLGYVE
jgi:type I restriction enzyme M protein